MSWRGGGFYPAGSSSIATRNSVSPEPHRGGEHGLWEVHQEEKVVVASADTSLGEDGVGAVEGTEDADLVAEEDLGERVPKVARRPNNPTKAELDEHYPNHAHYRSWCPDCRAGRGISRQHRKTGDEPLGVTISLDYAFMYDDEKEEAIAPVLVAIDQSTKAI